MAELNILIVEDEAIVAEDIHYMLKSLNYNVVGKCSYGEEAIKEAESKHPGLILMDIMLKGEMDGIEATSYIQNKLDIPVIYLTAYSDDKTLQRAKLTKPYGYLTKPFEKKDLYTTIEIALYKYGMEKQLIESEKKYRTLFEDSGDAMYICNESENIIDVNQSAIGLFGYERNDILNKNINLIFSDKEDKDKIFSELDNKGQVRNYELNIIRKNGKQVPCLLTTTEMRSTERRITGYQGIIRDITKRKEKEKALKQKAEDLDKRYREINCLYSISNMVEKPGVKLSEIVQGTVTLIPKSLQHPNIIGVSINLMGDTYKTYDFKETNRKEKRDIIVNGENIGNLNVYYKDNFKKDNDNLYRHEPIFFSVIANRLSKIIEHIEVQKELKDSLNKLQEVTEGVIRAMATATEMKDPYTAGHQKRVSKLAVAISQSMKLSTDEIQGIKMAALIHDIGKISVPSEILNKPGKLSDIEFSIIKTHPQIGHDILKTIEFPWPIAEII
ncbi:MAG: PAS domain S-box protein, partial [Spirochaetota bacterium]